MRVTTLGVALDWDIAAGIRALDNWGSFDEISVGQNWLNTQSIRFGFRDFPGNVATPSLLLFTRVTTPHQHTITVSADSIVARASGASDMFALARALADSERTSSRLLLSPKLRGPAR